MRAWTWPLAVLAGCAAPAGDGGFRDIHGVPRAPAAVTDAKAHVLFFVTHDCPIANSYAPEIVQIAKDFAAEPVRFFVVHVDPDLTPERARKHARDYSLHLPVVIDAKHDLVAKTGVTITPEAAVLAPGGAMPYRGRIDDLYADLGAKRRAPRNRDLRDALRAVLGGTPVRVARTEAVGCDIPD